MSTRQSSLRFNLMKMKAMERMKRLRPLIEKANKDAERAMHRTAFFAARKAGTYIPKK